MSNDIEKLLSGVLSKVLAGGDNQNAMTLIMGLISSIGGIEALLKRFNIAGLTDILSAWMSGNNASISPKQILDLFGSQTVEEEATKVSLDTNQATDLVSQFLPEVVKHIGDVKNGGIESLLKDKAADLLKDGAASLLGSLFKK